MADVSFDTPCEKHGPPKKLRNKVAEMNFLIFSSFTIFVDC